MLCLGCGSGGADRLTKSEYLKKIEALASGPRARDANIQFTKVVVEPGLPRDDCATRMHRFEEDVDSLVSSVAALRPPAQVASLHEQFVRAARESVESVRDATVDAEAGTLHCGPPMNKRIYGLASTARAEAAIQGLADMGYVFSLNSND